MISKLSLRIFRLFLLLCAFNSGAQEISYQKLFHYSRFSDPSEIIVCNDKDYLLVGSVFNPSGSDWDFYAVKISVGGKILWQKKYDSAKQMNKANAVSQLSSDSSYILSGSSEYLMVDKNGKVILAKSFNTNQFFVQHIREVKGEGFIVHGYYNWPNPERNGVVLMMLDPSFNVKWTKYYGNTEPGNVRGAFTISKDNGYLLAYGNGAEYGNLTLIKTDNNGNVLSGKVFGDKEGLNNLRVYDAATLTNGDFIISGNIKSLKSPVLVKFNSNGELVWANKYLNFFEISEYVGVNKNSNDEIVFCCIGKTKDKRSDAYLTKIDTEGHVIWSKAYGSKISDRPCDFKIVKDSSFVILASQSDTTKNDFYMIKTGFGGRIGCNEKDGQTIAFPVNFSFLKDIKVETASLSGLAGILINFKEEDAGLDFDICPPTLY